MGGSGDQGALLLETGIAHGLFTTLLWGAR